MENNFEGDILPWVDYLEVKEPVPQSDLSKQLIEEGWKLHGGYSLYNDNQEEIKRIVEREYPTQDVCLLAEGDTFFAYRRPW